MALSSKSLAAKLPDWTRWLRIARTENSATVLSRHHIYILPTRYGWFFALVLFIMLIGAINYTLSLGFVLVFLLAGTGSMGILHTWRNLAHLHITAGRMEPVFAGDDAIFEIVVSDTRHRTRYAVAARFDHAAPVYADIPSDGQNTIPLKLASNRRGWLAGSRIKLYTEFPLALFHAWAYVDLDCRCLVYPRPAVKTLPLPVAPDQSLTASTDVPGGDDDFIGHRTYQLGDSPKRIDWKASSREQGLLTKQFQGRAQNSLWLDWSSTPGSDDEQRIRQLTRWIIDADLLQQPYGLRLPGHTLPPAAGKHHYHQCLQALALL